MQPCSVVVFGGAVFAACALAFLTMPGEEAAAASPLCATLASAALPERIVVVGDVHGDAEALEEVLEAAGVITSADCVARDNATLVVQMGDLVDRGRRAARANACLATLQRTGRVARLVGNHELMWASGDYRFASQADSPQVIARAVETWIDDARAGRVVGAVAVGPFLFTHAGFRPAMLERVQGGEHTPAALADLVNAALRRAVDACSPAARPPCSFDGDLFSAGRDRGGAGVGGPFWTDFSVLAQAPADALPTGVIQVVGHSAARCAAWRTDKCEPIRARPDLAAIVVDAGLSEAYASNRAFLDIRHGRILARTRGVDGTYRDTDLTAAASCPSSSFDHHHGGLGAAEEETL